MDATKRPAMFLFAACAVFSLSEYGFQMNPRRSLGAGKAMNEQLTKSLTPS